MPPTLLHWDFNLNVGQVTLTFSETVYTAFFNYSRVIFTNSPYSPGHVTNMRVENPVNTTQWNSDVIVFTLNEAQYNLIQASHNLLSEFANSFLILEYNTVTDTVVPIPNQNVYHTNVYQGTDATWANPRPVRAFYNDVTRPRLVSFSLDMDARRVALLFSETVSLSSLQLDQMTLQADRNIGVTTEFLVLNTSYASVITTVDSPLVELSLELSAFSRLKDAKYLAKSAESSFVSLTVHFVADRAGNATHGPNELEEVHKGNARMATNYVPDRSAPSLIRWFMNLALDQIVLTFSKPIEGQTMAVNKLVLSSDRDVIPSTVSLQLSDGSFVYDEYYNVVTVQMSVTDARRLRMLGSSNLCVSLDTCFLTLPGGFVNDSTSTSSEGETVRAPLQAVTRMQGSSFVVDTMPPMLLNYSIDLSTRVMSFFFNEVVNLRNINSSAIELSYQNASYQSVRLSKFGYPLTTTLNTKFDLQVTAQDYIRLQRADQLAMYIARANMSVDSDFSADLAGNQVILLPGNANGKFPPFEVKEDLTSPRLVAVFLHSAVGSRNITLYFSELVDVESIVQGSLLLASSSGTSVSLAKADLLTNATFSRAVSYSLVPLSSELTTAALATGQTNTHVYVGATGAVKDASRAQNRIAAMSITDAIRDGLSVISFRLDMSAGVIMLELSFPSAVDSVDPTKLTLFSADLSVSYVLTGLNGYTVDMSGPFLILELTHADYIGIRTTIAITSASSVVLLVGVSAVLDDAGKQLSAAVTLPCSYFVNDVSPLSVVSYELDLSVGTLRLNFNKEAQTSTLDLSSLVTLSSPTDSLLLANMTVIDEPNLYGYVAPNVTSLLLSLNNNAPLTTREQIVLAHPLASDPSMTFLSVEKGFVYDLARPRNPLQSVAAGAQMEPSSLILDELAPTFLSFDLDLSQRLLTLYFSEAVNMSSVNVEGILFLQNRFVASSTKYPLSSYSTVITTEPSRTVVIKISKFDIDTIVLLTPNLLTSAENTNIAMAVGTVYDLATPPNAVPVTLFRFAVPVQTFTVDAVQPKLLWYNISMETGDIVMYFDERLVCATIRPDRVILQSDAFVGKKSTFFQLSNATTVSCNYGPIYDPFVYVTLDPDDLIAIKAVPGFAKTQRFTFLRILQGFGKDIFDNPTEGILDGFALAPTQFIGDTTAPELLSFLISKDQQLSLAYSEPVEPRTIVIKEHWVQNKQADPTLSFPLVQAKLFRTDTVRMKLDFDIARDLEFMWRGQNLVAVEQNYTYLRASNASIRDLSGNALLARPRTNALHLGPAIISWEIDMNIGVLRLTFNEPVNPAFSLVGLRIQDLYDDDTNHLEFTTTTQMTAGAGAMVYVALSAHDMDSLKHSGLVGEPLGSVFDLATGTGSMPNLFITANFNVTRSLNAGGLQSYLPTVEVRTTNAVRIKRLIKDTTPPDCLSFSIDLNAGTLTLSFDEPVVAASLILTDLVVSSSATGRFVPLSNTDRNVALVGGTFLVVTLSVADLNAIKRAVSTSSGLQILDSLVMAAGAVKDLRGNPFIGNTADQPISVSVFTPDTTAPQLLSWTLDLSLHRFSLIFNEFVSYSTVRPSSLVLLSSSNLANPSLVRFQLTNYSKLYQGDVSQNEVLLDLELYRQDAFALESLVPQGLGINVSNTFLAISNLSDIFGNAQLGVQIVQASEVTPDTVSPKLEAFDFDYNSLGSAAMVTAYFSKVIEISSFDCHDFEMRSSPSASSLHVVQFSSVTCALQVGQTNSHVVEFFVPHAAFAGTTVGNTPDETWLGVPVLASGTHSTKDLSNNVIVPFLVEKYLRVGPQLLRFHMNVELGQVVYDFNKPLNFLVPFNAPTFGYYSTVTEAFYFLQSTSTVGGLMVLEALPEFASAGASSTIGASTLDQTDLFNMKILDITATGFFALTASVATLADADGFFLNEKTAVQKLLVSDLITDTTSPLILSLSIDLSLETIVIEVRIRNFTCNL